MKKKLERLLLIPAFAVAVSCSGAFDYREPSPDLLELSSTAALFSAASGTVRINVTADSRWTAATDEDWISVSPEEGCVAITAAGNKGVNDREGFVTVSTSSRTSRILVAQNAFDYHFLPASDTLKIGCDAELESIAIDCDINWTARPMCDWISLESGAAEGIAVSVASNPSLVSRMADIDFFCGEDRIGRVTVVQDPIVPKIEFDKSSFSFGKEAFSQTVSVDANYSWTASVSEVASSWLSVILPEAGPDGLIPAGKTTITLKGTEAVPSRKTVIIFSSGGVEFSISVDQEGLPTFITVDRTELSFPYQASSGTVSLTTNNVWEIVDLPSWASADPLTGVDGTIPISVSCKESAEPQRTGKFTIKSGDKTQDITLVQADGPFTRDIVFADGTNVFRDVLSPEINSSVKKANNLGVKQEKLVADPSYVTEWYSTGRTLASTATLGMRIQVEPAADASTSKALRKENFAYVKFPGLKGYRISKISSFFLTSGYVFVTTTYGTSNADAKSKALTPSDYRVMENTVNDFVLEGSAGNTPYYLFFPETNSGEVRFLNFAITYTPVTL